MVLPLQGESMGRRWAGAGHIKVVSSRHRSAQWGDVVVFERHGRMYAHRLILCIRRRYFTKGDARWAWDRPVLREEEIAGVVVELVGSSGTFIHVQRSRFLAMMHLIGAVVFYPALCVGGRRQLFKNKDLPPEARVK